MANVLQALIFASERAAKIARSCCTDAVKETLLVAEKCAGEANARFDQDFKTIADVLAQEAARYEISLRCPELAGNLRGEECAEINGVTIKICENECKTAELLEALIPTDAAKTMAEAAHADIEVDMEIPPIENMTDLNLGIWIDPIDATAEFIAGVRGEADSDHGLPCVTVLIGAYLMTTGEPVVGVINQPFVNDSKGNILWGASYGKTNCSNVVKTRKSENKTVLMSSAEISDIIEKFKETGWNVKSFPGAGNKLRKVAAGEAEAYIVSKGTTFRWDTCAPHAILKATGGDLLCYTTRQPVTYNLPDDCDTQQCANIGGIIAYSNTDVLNEVIKVLT
ncbi:inositol monophosphatase family domain-containing protein [Phthorimaea operculella]|nr:inositol monophosphatase family domain-containing protein [Phthorimaea operculella]